MSMWCGYFKLYLSLSCNCLLSTSWHSKLKLDLLTSYRSFQGTERTGEVDEDGEYEVIVVDQHNSSILASDHCSNASSGPPSLKVSQWCNCLVILQLSCLVWCLFKDFIHIFFLGILSINFVIQFYFHINLWIMETREEKRGSWKVDCFEVIVILPTKHNTCLKNISGAQNHRPTWSFADEYSTVEVLASLIHANIRAISVQSTSLEIVCYTSMVLGILYAFLNFMIFVGT